MRDPNEAQRTYWNSPVAERWAAADAVLGVLFAAAHAPILERAALAPDGAVIDVGCGSGALTVAAARIVAPGRVTGVDLSRPLLALAKERIVADGLTNVDVLEADAQELPFPAGEAAAVVSRFGTMFFSDPGAAFRNLHRALRPGGRIALAAWGPMAQNPWFALPRAAAVARLGAVPPVEPRTPGPFAFAEPDDFAELLREAGFAGVTVDPVPVTLHHPSGADDVVRLATMIGPAASIIRDREGTAADVDAIGSAIADAFAQFRHGDGISIPALLHLGSASRP